MADTSKDDLSYGQLGELSYDVESGQWIAQRNPRKTHVYRSLGQPRIAVKASFRADSIQHDRDRTEFTGKRRIRQTQDLIRKFPEIQPAANLLSPLVRVSEAIQAATVRYDPLVGDLLAFGTITSRSLRAPVRIVASPHGPNGSTLLLCRLQTQRRGWNDSREAWIEVPIVHGERAFWRGPGVPIQQICFAKTIEGSDAFMAVRLVNKTIIFRPFMDGSTMESLSKIHQNPIAEISIRQTNGLQHTHVAFNPWYAQHFGIIDYAGNWTIWELRGRKTSQVACICRGTMYDGAERHVANTSDGWARLVWVGGPGTIVICSRTKVTAFDISLAAPSPVFEDQLNGLTAVRDILRLPYQPHFFSVLTSSQLLVYNIEAKATGMATLRRVLITNHFRGSEDLSLCLHGFVDEDDVIILIRSRLTSLVTQHRVHFPDSGTVTISDPSLLDVPEGAVGPEDRLSCAGIDIQSLPFAGKGDAVTHQSTASNYSNGDVRFKLFTFLARDLTLTQTLYVATAGPDTEDHIAKPSWESKYKATSSALLKEAEEFIDDEDSDVSNHSTSECRPRSWLMHRQLHRSIARNAHDWTANFRRIAGDMEGPRPQSGRAFAEALDLVEGLLLRSQTAELLPIRTMRDYSGDRTITDLELASQRLQGLGLVRSQGSEAARHAERQDETLSSSLLVLRTLNAPCISGPSLVYSLEQVYDHVIADWISSLSPRIPGSIRLAKERLVRHVAAEIALSSRVLRIEEQPQPPEPSQSPEVHTPVRPSASSSAQHLANLSSHSQMSSQSILPTPSPTATPSITTQSSHPSSLLAPELSRLSRYTTFSRPPPTALPRSLTRVLAHWEPGTDPATYDWLPTSRRVAQREDEEFDAQALTEKERARLQRRAERHIRRQRREAAASQASQIASSQAIQIFSASQPAQPQVHQQQNERQSSGAPAVVGNYMPSSQGQGYGAAAASQVVPGRFGGRPPAKKKRKQGF